MVAQASSRDFSGYDLYKVSNEDNFVIVSYQEKDEILHFTLQFNQKSFDKKDIVVKFIEEEYKNSIVSKVTVEETFLSDFDKVSREVTDFTTLTLDKETLTVS